MDRFTPFCGRFEGRGRFAWWGKSEEAFGNGYSTPHFSGASIGLLSQNFVTKRAEYTIYQGLVAVPIQQIILLWHNTQCKSYELCHLTSVPSALPSRTRLSVTPSRLDGPIRRKGSWARCIVPDNFPGPMTAWGRCHEASYDNRRGESF